MENIYTGSRIHARLGSLWIAASERGLALLDFNHTDESFQHLVRRRFARVGEVHFVAKRVPVVDILDQVEAYLQGRRRDFDFASDGRSHPAGAAIDWRGLPPFQEKVLQLTYAIPYGSTCTYADLARQLGKPQAARAVGQAEARNPIPLVIPCHRVVGSDGAYHGYGGPGGISTKKWLLEMERAALSS